MAKNFAPPFKSHHSENLKPNTRKDELACALWDNSEHSWLDIWP